uniref:Mos1 transposase HTH domain-containing protein n=1 Tax=Ditylenchus dipsaci TaxID=166011 RepID=A0A915E5Q5_9BILA
MKGKKNKSLPSDSEQSDQQEAISLNKNGQILLRIRAKPGAKQSAITDVGEDEIGVAIAAPAREGEANQELLHCMIKFLGIKKSEIEFEKARPCKLASENGVPSSKNGHLRHILLYPFNKHKNAAKATKSINNVYGEGFAGLEHCEKVVRKVQRWRLLALLAEDPRQTARELALEFEDDDKFEEFIQN